MKKSYKQLLKLIKKECDKHNVKLEIRDVSYVKIDSMRCSGYFDPTEDNLKIVVAKKAKSYKATLLHEYCHLTQYLDKNCKIWRKSGKSLEIVHNWLSGTDYPDKSIKKHMGNCRDLELDNEKRAAKLCAKYNVDMSVDKYIKQANAYVLFYNWMLETRKWSSTKNSPYRNKNLKRVMSSKFDMNYKKLDPKIEEVFRKEKI